jgi:hypothetical protein
MAAPALNLFLRLHKWAARQDENFCTEALVLVLQRLLDHQPEVGVSLLEVLTAGLLCVPVREAAKVELQTQVVTTEGRPDIGIRWADHLVVVEVKVEAELHDRQLGDYRILCKKSGVGHSCLVLLTRYPPTIPDSEELPRLVRWYHVADTIDKVLQDGPILDPATRYLCEQFTGFLRARNMVVEKVSWHMPDGLRSWGNFLKMLLEAAAACKVSATMKGAVDKDSIGVKFDGKYYVSVGYETPETLWFSTSTRIDREEASKLGVGEVAEASWVPGRYRWWRSAELDSEPIHFFARSKVSQMQWLEGFLRECLAQAHSIETQEQPLTPDEPEEG